MNPGKTLVGGVIGAAVAIGVYVLLKTQMHMDAVWFPVVIGILTGLGVRQAEGSAKGVSYLRGAVSGIIAAGAILAAEEVVKFVLTKDTAGATVPQVAVADTGDDEEGEDADVEVADDADDAEAPEVPEDKTAITGGLGGEVGAANQNKRDDIWPFLFMAVGIFLAYELARGSASPTTADADAGGESSEPPPESEPAGEQGDEEQQHA